MTLAQFLHFQRNLRHPSIRGYVRVEYTLMSLLTGIIMQSTHIYPLGVYSVPGGAIRIERGLRRMVSAAALDRENLFHTSDRYW